MYLPGNEFADNEIVLFIGYSADAKEEAFAIRNLEAELQGRIDVYKNSIKPNSFDRVRCCTWDANAASEVGGQSAVINPIIQRANVAVFIFKKRIGETTWHELRLCIERKIPIFTFFAKAESAGVDISNRTEIKDWDNLLEKRKSLTEDWNKHDSISLTPQPEYTTPADLQQIAKDRLEKTIAGLLGSHGSGRFRASTVQVKPDALSDVDRDSITTYKAQLRPERLAALVGLSDVHFLEAQGCMRDGALTTAGILFFTAHPTRHLPSAFVRGIKYSGSDRTSERMPTIFDANIIAQLNDVRAFIEKNIDKWELPTSESMRSDVVYQYPMVCIREVVANALCHRDYNDTERWSAVRIFSDRIEITNPGAWIGAKFRRDELAALSELRSESIQRNIDIAKCLSDLNYVEMEGSGIPSALRDCKTFGAPEPQVELRDGYVVVTVFPIRDLRHMAREATHVGNTQSSGTMPARASMANETASYLQHVAREAPRGDSGWKPVIFISYSHKDEPEHPRDGEVQWLSFVRTYLQPAVKDGVFDLWVDRHMTGGEDWGPELERNLRECDIFILLVSAHSMASDYIIDKEIAIICERQTRGETVHFFPLLLTPTPEAGLGKVQDKNLRPRDGKPLSGYSARDRQWHMWDVADEIARLAERIARQKSVAQPSTSAIQRAYVDITGLPETGYERLVGRDAELKRLDDAWADRKTSILSLIAEGGAGKSAVVNEWLKRMQADHYRGAEAVLGWSFYSQGSKERATSAEPFLNWALHKLGIEISTTSATAKGEAIAEALARRRVLLVLDGCEPLQHGLGAPQGELKDLGLRALLRRFAAMPPAEAHGLMVLTSREAVKDVARWKDGTAPVLDVRELSDEAGAALLRDNGVWGTDSELRAEARAFGGHPLALGLLASFLKETQAGDVRRRDHIREFFADPENPRHDHAKRVMESYESEWLAGQPVPQAIMHMVGLFDRPASGDCLAALRCKPTIPGLTDVIVDLDEGTWQRAVARLRDVRLLAPQDPSAPGALDAHPLVREWFGQRLDSTKRQAWRAAHGRLYEHLRDTTREGETPTLEDLAPLYQAIPHGCRAGRHQEALGDVYKNRICRRSAEGWIESYALRMLGAVGSNLAAISWFFQEPYEKPIATLTRLDQAWVLGEAGVTLRAEGRLAEALLAQRAELRMRKELEDWTNAAIGAANLSGIELLAGEVAAAVATAKQSTENADRSGDGFPVNVSRSASADALHAAGRREEAEHLLADTKQQRRYPLLYSLRDYQYCDLLLARGERAAAQDWASQTLEWVRSKNSLLDIALDTLALGRIHLGSALEKAISPPPETANGYDDARTARTRFDQAVNGLRRARTFDQAPRGLLARAAFRRSVGDRGGAARDLDEVEEIAEPGPMRLFLCDLALERARLAFARIAAFAPLNGLIDDSPPQPTPPGAEESAKLAEEARGNLATARELIGRCGYHRRDEELAELEAVRDGRRRFADLPPRV